MPNSQIPYSIEKFIDQGIEADKIQDPDKRKIIWENLGKFSTELSKARLSEQDLKQYRFGFDGGCETQTWEEHLEKVIAAINIDQDYLTQEQKNKLIQLLRDFNLYKYPMSLCHGDLKLDNVFVDEDSLEIMAVFDSELAKYAPRFVGEMSTSFDPAVLDVKIGVAAHTLEDRNAFAKGLGFENLEEIMRDFLIYYAGDAFMNIAWYNKQFHDQVRPDIAILRTRFNNYQNGLQEDMSALRLFLAS